ncbi:MAG: hypothetical protein E7035_05570 [Verrucomicrobiaceae bacterium]|nr:hypothetical protein [Verrucomicrobiaceae bacterium]
MANKYFFGKNNFERSVFYLQKIRINKHFPNFNVTLKNNRLVCNGYLNPISENESYHVRINYKLNNEPQVWILGSDEINKCAKHKYKDGSLCLFYPKEFKWKNSCNIHETIIPWIAEWIVCFKYWKKYGEWGALEAPHRENK